MHTRSSCSYWSNDIIQMYHNKKLYPRHVSLISPARAAAIDRVSSRWHTVRRSHAPLRITITLPRISRRRSTVARISPIRIRCLSLHVICAP